MALVAPAQEAATARPWQTLTLTAPQRGSTVARARAAQAAAAAPWALGEAAAVAAAAAGPPALGAGSRCCRRLT